MLFSVVAVVFVLSLGTLSADTTDTGVGKESVAPQEHNAKPIENRDVQDEDANALNKALKLWFEAMNSLLNAYGEEPLNKYADYETMASNFESLFNEYDSDGDGGLSVEELGSAAEKDMTEMFESLSPDELQGKQEDLHSGFDRDGNGSVTLDEVSDFFVEAAQELNEMRDEHTLDKPNEKHVSDLTENEDGGQPD